MSDKFDRLCALVKRADELRRVSDGAYKTAFYERQTGSLRITTSDYNREMTAAQKAYAKRAMEIIRELEQAPRGVYCGAIGGLGYNGESSLSIAIERWQASGK